MKIKTVARINPTEFDLDVNTALDEGYLLAERRLVNTPLGTMDYHYAQLVLPDPPVEAPEPEAPDLLACMRAIFDTCNSLESCTECPLTDYCQYRAPDQWERPPEVQG